MTAGTEREASGAAGCCGATQFDPCTCTHAYCPCNWCTCQTSK
jgi:hypothetical protein